MDAREFWICEYENEVCGDRQTLERIAPEADPIHVIEYGAFEQLRNALITVLEQPFKGSWDAQAVFVQKVLCDFKAVPK